MVKPNVQTSTLTSSGNAKHIKIRTDNGWQLDTVVKGMTTGHEPPESLADKLRRSWKNIFTADYDFTDPNNREQIKKYVIEFNKILNNSGKNQVADYAKMLAYSKNDAERDVFDGILREIDPTFRAQFVSSWLYSYDSDEARMNAANRTDISEIAEGTDNESTKEIAHVVRKNQSEEGIKKSDEKIFNETDKYYEENNLKEIIEKAANGAELTEKEQAIYEKWQHIEALISGATTGTIANEYISTDFKEQHLHNFVNPKIFSYGEISYRNIINEVSKYFSNHPEELKNTEINLTELLNKVTDGNYEIIVSGDKNAVLNAPGSAETSASNTAATSSSENASSCRTDLGFATKPAPVQKAEPQKTETTEKSAKEDEKITEEKAIKGGLVELDAYTQKMSLKEKVLFILTKKKKDVQAIQRGYNLLSRATESVQKDIYENDIRDGSVKAGILAHHVLSDSVVENLNATSYIESQSLKIAQKEIKEEKERKHKFTNSIMDNLRSSFGRTSVTVVISSC